MLRTLVTRAFADADIVIGGKGTCDIRVKHNRFYRRVALFHSLGLGRSYMEDDFECDDIRRMLYKMLEHQRKLQLARPFGYDGHTPHSLPERWIKFLLKVSNQQTAAKAARAIGYHYDVGNGFYELLLGTTMTYSCGYWPSAEGLEQAQLNKYRHVSDKLDLKRGMRVLEIGCGWGGAGAYVATRNPGVTVACVTLSKKQYDWAKKEHKTLIDQGRLEFYLMDYRKIPEKFKEKFDAVFSIGMFEHVGPSNYGELFRIVRNCLQPHRPFVLHSIFGNGGIDPFIWYYIFPGGILPTEVQVAEAVKPYFVVEHVENFGFDYALTLAAWRANLRALWSELWALGYSERFLRMYDFYLALCEVGFAVRRVQLQQWTLSVGGIEGGFQWNRPHYQN